MFSKIFWLLSVLAFASGSEQQVEILTIGNFDECEGKESANYTYIDQIALDSSCSQTASKSGLEYLIGCEPNGKRVVNSLNVLAYSDYPAGAYYQAETLYLGQSGNLNGKYVYLKTIGLRGEYLKKCSSVLGYSYISTKSQVLLIADKLDLNIFLNPGGAFELFKRKASTVCKGRSNSV